MNGSHSLDAGCWKRGGEWQPLQTYLVPAAQGTSNTGWGGGNPEVAGTVTSAQDKHSRRGKAMDREERVKQRAQEIWEREGRPEGREQQHWYQALEEIAVEEDGTLSAAGEEDPEPVFMPSPAVAANPANASDDSKDKG
jgi:hypothetical protein